VHFVTPAAAGLTGKLRQEFEPLALGFGMNWRLDAHGAKRRVLVMVSKFGHCLNDLLFRARTGELPVEIVAVVSNHLDHQRLVEWHGIPFFHLPVTADTKPAAEAKLLDLADRFEVELVVLARYMQVLSDSLATRMQGRVINIHHSFLPSFKGANPYKQAYERGVKLIGATAHYVTEDLDEGPIIEQDVARITHAQSAADYVSIGRDVESQVLARAVHAHIHHRVFMNGNKTIVFPASPGSYASERMG
jgi:formyltetrahydrofolate deformylase